MDYTASTYTPATLADWQKDPTKLTADTTKAMAGDMQSATTWTPDDNALVSNNLNKLLSSDSPYIQSARTRAAQYSNSRGLLNSSIGAGAGESAAIDASLPIAQADASMYGRSQSENASAKNAFSLDANRFGREGALAAVRAGFEVGAQDRTLTAQSADSAAQRGLTADTAAKDLAYKQQALAADQAIRQGQLGISQADLNLRTAGQASDIGFKTADQALREKEINQRIASDQAQVQQKNAVMLQELQRTYMDARLQLETTPNLDGQAKAKAIIAMDNHFNQTLLPDLRIALGNPDAWPKTATAIGEAASTTTNAGTTPAASPAPAPAAPAPSPYVGDWNRNADGSIYERN
jgi:hypothetical protein